MQYDLEGREKSQSEAGDAFLEHTSQGEGLLEEDTKGCADARDANLSVAANGDTQRLVVEQPGVEGGQGIQVGGNGHVLGDVDGNDSLALCWGKLSWAKGVCGSRSSRYKSPVKASMVALTLLDWRIVLLMDMVKLSVCELVMVMPSTVRVASLIFCWAM